MAVDTLSLFTELNAGNLIWPWQGHYFSKWGEEKKKNDRIHSKKISIAKWQWMYAQRSQVWQSLINKYVVVKYVMKTFSYTCRLSRGVLARWCTEWINYEEIRVNRLVAVDPQQCHCINHGSFRKTINNDLLKKQQCFYLALVVLKYHLLKYTKGDKVSSPLFYPEKQTQCILQTETHVNSNLVPTLSVSPADVEPLLLCCLNAPILTLR